MTLHFTDEEILAARPPRNPVDPKLPYHFLVEPELGPGGRLQNTATIFLTNRECPFRCLMCDLWKNTTETSVPAGAVPEQIRYALERLPAATQLKLYNSGNFFDPNAIPREDLAEIANLAGNYETLIVENHPKLCSDQCGEFQQQCGTQLEIAMGLETSEPAVLATLNKRMTVDDFKRACERLLKQQIRVRSFVLLRPPGVSEAEGITQALNSLRFAFDCGVECCSIIPVRGGNGIMEQLQRDRQFMSPSLRSLELVQQEALTWSRGRIFSDLWEIDRFADCRACAAERIERIRQMNLTQHVSHNIGCDLCDRQNL